MQLSAILLARTIAFLQVQQVDPRGRLSQTDFLKAFASQYQFEVTPPNLTEVLDPQKNWEFRLGKLDEINIDRVVIFQHAVIIDTRSSTDDSDRVMDHMLEWATRLGGTQPNIQIARKSYWSQLTFHSDFKFLLIHPILASITAKVSQRVSDNLDQKMDYDLYGIHMTPDPTSTKFAPAGFSIERLAETPFSERKYFSSAPLPTNEHISILEEFESAIGQ